MVILCSQVRTNEIGKYLLFCVSDKGAKKFKNGDEPRGKDAGPSGAKIGAQTAKTGANSVNIDTVKEGTVFMDLSILFGGLDNILKSPDCGKEMKSHVDMRKKHGYAHYISCSVWKYCFYTSKKQGSPMK